MSNVIRFPAPPTVPRIYKEVYEALNNSIDNGYPHPWEKSSLDLALDIEERTGIFDGNDWNQLEEAIDAIRGWRYDNLQ